MFKKILLAMGIASMILFGTANSTATAVAAEEYTYDVLGSVDVTASDMKDDGSYEITVTWELGKDYRDEQAWAKTFNIYGAENKFSKAFETADKGSKTFTFYGEPGTYLYSLRTSVGFVMGEITVGGGASAEYQAVIDKNINKWVSATENNSGDNVLEKSWMANSNNAGVPIPAYGTVIDNYEEIAVPRVNPSANQEINYGPTAEENQKAAEEFLEALENVTPVPTATPSPEPTVAPTATPVPTEVPEITAAPTDIPEVTPVVTEVPEVTPELTVEHTAGQGSLPNKIGTNVDGFSQTITPDEPEDQSEITTVPEITEAPVIEDRNNPSSDVADEVSTGTPDVDEEKVDFSVPVIFGVCFIGMIAIIVVLVFSSKKRG